MPDLRLRSRQDYLKKRETERLALLRKQVSEEQMELRENPDLTRREREEFARNAEVLRIAEERLKVDEYRDGYAMPEDYITEKGKIDRRRKEEVLFKRYVDRDERGRRGLSPSMRSGRGSRPGGREPGDRLGWWGSSWMRGRMSMFLMRVRG